MRHLALAAITLLIVPGEARAAEFEVVHSDWLNLRRVDEGACSIFLRGRINRGDEVHLRALLASDQIRVAPRPRGFEVELEAARATSLCLDSEGGDLLETIAIIRLLTARGIVTTVPANATCLSACAFIFLAGTLDTAEEGRMPYRILSTSGRLAFHAPAPDGEMVDPALDIPAGAALQYYRDAVSAIRLLTAAYSVDDARRRDVRFATDLVIELLAKFGETSFYEITTVDQAGRFEIRLTDVQPLQLDGVGLNRACENVVIWRSRLHPLEAPDFANRVVGDLCTLEGALNPGDDDVVSLSGADGSSARIRIEPWQGLPFFVPIRQIAANAPALRVSEVQARYFRSPYPVDQGLDLTIGRLLPGYTYFGGTYEPGELDVGDPIVWELRPGGRGRIRWKDGTVESISYSVRREGGLCLRRGRPPARALCSTYEHTHWDEHVWQFTDPALGAIRLMYARPGVVLPETPAAGVD